MTFQPLSWVQIRSRQPNSEVLSPNSVIRARVSDLGSEALILSTLVLATPLALDSAAFFSLSAVVRRSSAERETAWPRLSRSRAVSALVRREAESSLAAAGAPVVPSLENTPLDTEIPVAAAATPE